MATKREWDSVIAHWERLVSGNRREDEYIGVNDCAFCRRYHSRYNLCKGCPIYKETGKRSCRGTPYDDIGRYFSGVFLTQEKLDYPEFKELARVELEWLKELRKKVRGD